MKLITYRPFPREAIKEALKGAKKVAVLEKAISPGANTAPLTDEVASLLYDLDERPEIRNFIIGLGGKDVSLDRVHKIYDMTKNSQGKKQEWIF